MLRRGRDAIINEGIKVQRRRHGRFRSVRRTLAKGAQTACGRRHPPPWNLERGTIAPRLPGGTLFDPKAETALTLAMLQFALNGLGIAWLPLSLVAEMLTIGRLQRVEGLPEQPLDLKLFRLSDGPMTREDRVWQRLSGLTGTMVPSKALPDGQPGAVEPFQ